MFELSLNTLPLTIYTGTSLQYIHQLRYLDIDLEASELAPFYPSISCIPSRSNSTSALREPLFITVCFACNFLLVAVPPSHYTRAEECHLLSILAEDPLEKPPRKRASDNRIAPRLSQADVQSRHNMSATHNFMFCRNLIWIDVIWWTSRR